LMLLALVLYLGLCLGVTRDKLVEAAAKKETKPLGSFPTGRSRNIFLHIHKV